MASVGTITGEAFACGFGSRVVGVTYNFQEGSVVYSYAKAIRGQLERVAIKRVRISYKYGQPVISYTDTFNAFWMEEELCTESVAVAAAIAFLEAEQARISEALTQCNNL